MAERVAPASDEERSRGEPEQGWAPADQEQSTACTAQPERPVKHASKRPSAKQFRFGYLIHDASRIRRTVMDQIMRPYGITRSQWSVLSALSRGGNKGMTQVDLSRLLEVGKVSIGGLVDRLEASGHVERRTDATDRRVKPVFITERGFRVLSLMITVSTRVNCRILKGLTPDEIIVTENVLMKVKANLKEISEETNLLNRTGKFDRKISTIH